MKTAYPIYIPSKGRADSQKTVKLLLANDITDFYVVVEHNEREAYKSTVSKRNLLVLPGSDYGTSSVARNVCIEHSKKRGYAKHWQFDDDITYVMEHSLGVQVSTDLLKILLYIEKVSDSSPTNAVTGIRTIDFLRRPAPQFTRNTSLTSLYLLKNLPSIRFRGTMYVDIDYQLQCLRKGYTTLRCNDFAFRFITPLIQKGGYYSTYADDKKRMESIKYFLANNPDVNPTVERTPKGYLQLTKIGSIWQKFKKEA